MCDNLNWDLGLFFNEYIGIDGTSIDDLIDDLAQTVGCHQSNEVQGAEDFAQRSGIKVVPHMHDLPSEKHQTTGSSSNWNKPPISNSHRNTIPEFEAPEIGSWYMGIDGELHTDDFLNTKTNIISVRSDLFPVAIENNAYFVEASAENTQKIHERHDLSFGWTDNFMQTPGHLINSVPISTHQHNQLKRKNSHFEVAENANKRTKLTSDFYLMRDDLMSGSLHPFFNYYN